MATRTPRQDTTRLVYLEEIHEALRNIVTISYKLYHLIGIFKYEETLGKDVHIWNLIDETSPDGLKICIRGMYSTYPKPKTGDIVRIHRIRLKIGQQYPECPQPQNVVLWRTFIGGDPERYESLAKSPTITPVELERRKKLESFIPYTKISDICSLNTDHIDIAGRVLATNTCDGLYHNHAIQLMDGTQLTSPWESFYQDKILKPISSCDSVTIKIYSKQTPYDTDDHINVALALKEGDLVYMSNVRIFKVNNSKIKLELGSNHKFGKCIRLVHPSSLFGQIVLMNLKRIEPDTDEDCFSDDSSQMTDIYNIINLEELTRGQTSIRNAQLEQNTSNPNANQQSMSRNETNTSQMELTQNIAQNGTNVPQVESSQNTTQNGTNVSQIVDPQTSTPENNNPVHDISSDPSNISNSIFDDSFQLIGDPVPAPAEAEISILQVRQASQLISVTREVLKLDSVVRSLKEKDTNKIVDIYGIFVFEDLLSQACRIWKLMDESCPEGMKIRLVGLHQPFPKPLSGDIIRIHRLDIKYGTAYPECSQPANIVIWPGFQALDCPHISVSRNPTLTQEDFTRKSDLEEFFSFTKIEDIGPSSGSHVNLAGKIIALNTCDEVYGNFLLQIFDGSKFRTPFHCLFSESIDPKPSVDKRILDNSVIIKIYSKQRSSDTDAHVNTVRDLKVNDFIYIANVRMTWVSGRIKFELSSNLLFGKCVRKIDKRSIVGERISRDVDILSFNEVEMIGDSYEENLSRTSTIASNNSNISDYSNLSNYEDCVGT